MGPQSDTAQHAHFHIKHTRMSGLEIEDKYIVTTDLHAEKPSEMLAKGAKFTMNVGPEFLTFVPNSSFAGCVPKPKIPLASVYNAENYKPSYTKPSLLLTLADGMPALKLWVDGGEEILVACIDKILAMCKLLKGDIIVCGTFPPAAPPTPTSITFFDPKVSATLFSSVYRTTLAKLDTIEKVPAGPDVEAGYIQVKRTASGVICTFILPNPDAEELAEEQPCFVITSSTSTLELPIIKMGKDMLCKKDPCTAYSLLSPGGDLSTATPVSIPLASSTILQAPTLLGFELLKLPKMPEPKPRSTSYERKSMISGVTSGVKRYASIRKGEPVKG